MRHEAAGLTVLLMLYSITALAEDALPTPNLNAMASSELISLRDATGLAQATLEACAKLGQPASVVVMDADGFQRVALSDDRALYIGITTAAQKAITVLTFRTATEVLQKRASIDPQFAEQYSKERGYRLSPGGLPIYRGDRFVGALAVAGARDHEGECAYAGLRALSWATATIGVANAQKASEAVSEPAADPKRVLVSDGIPGVVAPGTKTEFIRGGLNGAEGVIRMSDGSALFCEQEANRVIRIDLEGNFSTYLEDTNRSIGLAFDHKGRLISTQSRDPRIGVLAPTRMTLADSFEGQPLVKPNALVVDRKGGIYFSDPLSNVKSQFRDPPPGRKSLILYLRPDGTLIKPTDAIAQPHKLTLSPDEKTFYATDGDRIVALDVQSDGTLVNPHTFANVRAEDLVVDGKSRLYASTDDGIEVLSPAGQKLGLIPTPIHIQSFAFTGKDRRTIYAVARGNVYRVSMLAAGLKARQK